MEDQYRNYTELAEELELYSAKRKGEISRLAHRASQAITELVKMLKEQEDDGK